MNTKPHPQFTSARVRGERVIEKGHFFYRRCVIYLPPIVVRNGGGEPQAVFIGSARVSREKKDPLSTCRRLRRVPPPHPNYRTQRRRTKNPKETRFFSARTTKRQATERGAA